jgi:hypothetical protein
MGGLRTPTNSAPEARTDRTLPSQVLSRLSRRQGGAGVSASADPVAPAPLNRAYYQVRHTSNAAYDPPSLIRTGMTHTPQQGLVGLYTSGLTFLYHFIYVVHSYIHLQTLSSLSHTHSHSLSLSLTHTHAHSLSVSIRARRRP